MAERQIAAAAVDVDLLAEVMHDHRRAFDVPTRPPWPELRGICRLGRRRPTPHRKAQRVALCARPDDAQRILVAQLADHRTPRAARQPAVAAVPAYLEVQP